VHSATLQGKPRADRSPEEVCEIVLKWSKNGNISGMCRLYGVAQAVMLINELGALR